MHKPKGKNLKEKKMNSVNIIWHIIYVAENVLISVKYLLRI